MHQEVDSVHYYVTMRDADTQTKLAWLMGPFTTFALADKNRRPAIDAAVKVNPWHHFDAFGVAALPDHLTPSVAFPMPDEEETQSDYLATVPVRLQTFLDFGANRQEAEG